MASNSTSCRWQKVFYTTFGQGVPLKVKKTKISTIQTQPPQQLRTRGGVTVDVLQRASPHKWLGCLLHPRGYHDAHVDFHPHAAPRAFHANRWILIDLHVSLATRLRYFDFDTIWFVLQQGTGRFSKMTSTILMGHSENCFEAWSAHLLPQTGHDLGMKSCMTGMHGWVLPIYLRTVGCPAF